jgi:hypothetical protein
MCLLLSRERPAVCIVEAVEAVVGGGELWLCNIRDLDSRPVQGEKGSYFILTQGLGVERHTSLLRPQ